MYQRHIMGGALWAAAIVAVAGVAPATTATPTASVTCAPTGTPYCANRCEPCPTVRAACYAVACGECHENPVCGDDEVCIPSGTGGCCTCAGAPTPTPTPTVASIPCPGDCDGSGAVEINEIIAAVDRALGQSGLTVCAGVDRNADGVIAIDELIVLVGTALRGCPAHVLADLDGVFDIDGWQSTGDASVPVGGLAVIDRAGARIVIEIVFSVLNHLSLTADPSGGTTLTLSGGGVEGGDVVFTAHGGATVAPGADALVLTADITVDSFVTGPATLHLTLRRPNGGTLPGLNGTYRLRLQHEAAPTPFGSTFDLMVAAPSSGRAACTASPDVRDDDGAVLAVLGDATCLISPTGLLWYVGGYGDDGRPLQMFGRLRAVGDVIGGEFWVAQFPSVRDRGSWTVELQQIEIAGTVYDGVAGGSAPLDGAEIEYVHHAASGDISGTVQTDAEGHYRIALRIGPFDRVDVTATAPGFAGETVSIWAYGNPGDPVDFGLPPSGGTIAIEPLTATIDCVGRIDVTIRNLGPPGETLAITELTFEFGYSQGEYGRDFTWDLSAIHFPVLLDSGAALSFPVYFNGTSSAYGSRLSIGARSGAHNAAGALYHGQVRGCGPTPTPTA